MSGKILIVEDNAQNRLLFQDLLAFYGYQVLVAADGAEGVSLAREHRPDLILMDIHMPVMNGIEAGRILRSDPRTKDIKMLVLSSSCLRDDDRHFLATGFDGQIDKPIDIRQLAATINKHLTDEESP
ncbi:MAG: response regulator [Geobacteraceae bacterium]|nr:response regulator [Geobacteraceae bacterium]